MPVFSDEAGLTEAITKLKRPCSIVADNANTTNHMVRRKGKRTAETRIVETAVIHSPSMVGSMGFNAAMPNQVYREVQEWLAVDVEDVTYEVLTLCFRGRSDVALVALGEQQVRRRSSADSPRSEAHKYPAKDVAER
jgi:hypothetical protein